MTDNYINITGHECSAANQLYTKTSRTSRSKPTWRSSDGLFEIFKIKWDMQQRWILHGSKSDGTFNCQTSAPAISDTGCPSTQMVGVSVSNNLPSSFTSTRACNSTREATGGWLGDVAITKFNCPTGETPSGEPGGAETCSPPSDIVNTGWSTTGSNELCGATDSNGPGTGPWNTGLHDGTFTSISECAQACDDDTNCDSFSVHPNGLHGAAHTHAHINHVICNGHPVGAIAKSTGSNPWRCYKKNTASHISDSAGAGNTNMASPVPGASSLQQESSSTSTSTSGDLPSQPTCDSQDCEVERSCGITIYNSDWACNQGPGARHGHAVTLEWSGGSNRDFSGNPGIPHPSVESTKFKIHGNCDYIVLKDDDTGFGGGPLNHLYVLPDGQGVNNYNGPNLGNASTPIIRRLNSCKGSACCTLTSDLSDDWSQIIGRVSDCDNGWYLADNYSKCRSCLDGQVAGPGATECITCPAGKSANAERTACVDCGDGYFSENPTNECTRCEAGHISNSTNTECVQCEAGKYSNSQRTACLNCSVGQYSNAGSTNCVRCGSGEYAPAGSAVCSTCAAGKHSISPNPGGSCIDCAAGKYSDEEGASSCISCGNGKYSTAVGSFDGEDCDNCPVGQRAISNHTSCGDCPNPIANASSITCNDAGVSTIATCNEGYRSVAGRCVINHCLCENGTGVITNGTDQVCLNHNNSNNPQCRECDPGYHLVGNECILNICLCEDQSSGRDIGAAKGAADTNTICEENGITDCHICRSGYHLSDHTPEGGSGRTTKECVPNQCSCGGAAHVAATGDLEINGSSACLETGDRHCISCDPGFKFRTDITATSNGSSVTYGEECIPYQCEEDERVQNNECVTCPAGKLNLAGDAAAGDNTNCDADNCPSNHYLSNHECIACPLGQESDGGEDRSQTENTTCTNITCEEDHKVSNNVCTPCEAGKTKPAGDDAYTNMNTECLPIICEIDERVQSHICDPCPIGKNNSTGEHDASGADTECDDIICEVGERVLANACEDCPTGSQNLEGGHNAGSSSETNCNHACNETVICEDPSKLIDPTIYCEGTCALTDEDLCCTLTKALCSTYTDDCPTGKSLNDTNYCSGIECSGTDDVDLCCIQNATCGSLTESCPSGKIIDENVNCSSLTCGTSDLETCCIIDTTSSTGTGTSATNIQKINSTATYSEASIADIAEGSTERVSFEESFIQAIRDNLGIPDLVVVINGISEGSVIVDFSIEVNNMTNEEATVESQKLTDNPTGLDIMIGETQQTAQLSEITVVEEETTVSAAAGDINGNIIKEVTLPIDGSLVKIAYSDSSENYILEGDETSIQNEDSIKLETSSDRVIQVVKKDSEGDYGIMNLPVETYIWVHRPIAPDSLNGPGQELYAQSICPSGSTDCNQDCRVVWSECTEECETKEERTSTTLVESSGTGEGCPSETVDCKKNHGKCDSSSDGGFIGFAIGFVVIFLILAVFIYLMSSGGGGGHQPSLPPMLVPPQPVALAAPAPAVR